MTEQTNKTTFFENFSLYFHVDIDSILNSFLYIVLSDDVFHSSNARLVLYLRAFMVNYCKLEKLFYKPLLAEAPALKIREAFRK